MHFSFINISLVCMNSTQYNQIEIISRSHKTPTIKNIRINGFVTVSPQVFIIENRVKATGPHVSCYMPFCRGATRKQGLAWAGVGWTVTEFPACLQQALLPRGTGQAHRGLGMLSKDVKSWTTGANPTGHCSLYTISIVLTVTSSTKTSPSYQIGSVTRGCETSHTEMGTLTNRQGCHQVSRKTI